MRLAWKKYSRRVSGLGKTGIGEFFRESKLADTIVLFRLMRKVSFFVIACGAALALAACGVSPPSPAKAEPAAPAIPAEFQSAAQTALGSEVEVLRYGDLAKNGHPQVLAINRVKTTPQTAAAGTLVTRAAVVEKDGETWREVFRCDEHLKNTNGFLDGTPLSPVAGWKLQYEQDAEKGLIMYFTPLEKPVGGYVLTLGVRWNPKVKRYQSLDRSFVQFLGEVPALETPQSQIAR